MQRSSRRSSRGGQVLKHLGLWEVKPRPPPQTAKIRNLFTEPHIDYSHRGVGPYGPEAGSQVPPSDTGFYVDPEYPVDLLI
jgi:hypothetical protein